EGQHEHHAVRGHVPARVVAHEQERTVLGNALEAPDLGPKVDRGQHPGPRQLSADVPGIPGVEIGRSARDERLLLRGDRAPLGLRAHARTPRKSRINRLVRFGSSYWGTCPQSSSTTDDESGSARSTCRANLAGT